jgi:hypothetical protein
MPKQPYSATDKAADRIPTKVEIGGKEFKVKRTGKALKKIINLTPDDESAEDPSVNVDTLYQGIGFLLVDQEGNNPDPEWLEDELDFEVAQDMMEMFLPRRAEGNSEEKTPSSSPSENGSDVQP